MDLITFGLERDNEVLIANISLNSISFRYKKLYKNGMIAELLNTGKQQLYNYIHYKKFLIIFDNNKLNKWTMYFNGETILRKYPNCILYNNIEFTNVSSKKFKHLDIFQDNKCNKDEFQFALNLFINKYQSLYFQINNKDEFQEEMLCLIEGNMQYYNSINELLEENFKDSLVCFINAEKDKENKYSIFTIKTLQDKFPDLKFVNKNNLLQECISNTINNEYIFDITYSREEILYEIYITFQNKLNNSSQKKINNYFERKNKKKSTEFIKTYLQTFKDNTIIKLSEEKEKRFIRYKNGEIELTDNELLEYNLIYSVVMDIYQSKLFNKKTNKPKPTFLSLDKKCEFTYKIIDCLYSNSVINDNDILNENQDFNECAKALFQLECDD